MQLRAGDAKLLTGVIPPGLKIGGATGANHLSFLFVAHELLGKDSSSKNFKTDSKKSNSQMTCEVDCGEVY